MGETHPTFNSSYSSYRLYQSDRHTTSLDAADQIIKVGIRPKKL